MINKPHRITWHWLLYILSLLLLLSSSPIFSSTQALLSGPRNLAHSEKHSWKAFSPPDQGDFLIHFLLSFLSCAFMFVSVCIAPVFCSARLFGKVHAESDYRTEDFFQTCFHMWCFVCGPSFCSILLSNFMLLAFDLHSVFEQQKLTRGKFNVLAFITQY